MRDRQTDKQTETFTIEDDLTKYDIRTSSSF